MTPQITTYEDVLNILQSFIRARGASVDQETLRYGVEAGMREIISARDWTCLRKTWRVPLVGTQSDGTATYSESGGAYPYLVTLADATVPSWAAGAQIRIGTDATICDIDQIISTTEFTLRSPRVPSEDIATASSYQMGRSWYELPADFVSSWAPAERNAWCIGEYIPFSQWHAFEKYNTWSGIPRYWSIGPIPDQYGVLGLYLSPWSSSTSEIDFVMKCRPRSLLISGKESWCSAGTVSVDADDTVVTGDGSTSFRSSMEGAIIRFADSTSLKPTGTSGSNPYLFQEKITDVDLETSALTIQNASSTTLADVKYTVSDPVDLNICMFDAFMRCCEKHIANACGLKDIAWIERQYQQALTQAKISDAQNMQRGTGSGPGKRFTRLADYYHH